MKLNHGREQWVRGRHNERGQTAIFLVLALSLFLLGFTGLAVDYSNLWFHRQAAQGAADAACQAGAMDMYDLAQGFTPGTTANFAPGFTPDQTKTYDCSSNSSATPCWYAAQNGYDGKGLIASTESNDVAFSFPASIIGITPPPTPLTKVPFMRVDVTDRVHVFLSALITGNKTQDVLATAKCGLVNVKAPIPLILLHPTAPLNSPQKPAAPPLSFNGTPILQIIGGPTKSVQINSCAGLQGCDSGADTVSFNGASNKINLLSGGPNYDGSSLGTYGLPSAAPTNFQTQNNGSWQQPSSPIPDPFALASVLPVPTVPGKSYTGPVKSNVPYLTDGCPDQTQNCDEYAPGYYPNGITIKSVTAIFQPGLYYVKDGFALQTDSLVRPTDPTKAPGDGTQGTVFYLTGKVAKCSGQSGLVCSGSNSGGQAPDAMGVTKVGSRTVDAFPLSMLVCSGAPPPDTRTGLTAGNFPGGLGGNILVAPCTGTYKPPNDTSGLNRGMLFFGDRDNAGGAGWGGGGSYVLDGTLYIHQCSSTDGTGLGTNCAAPTTGYNSVLTLSGASGSTSDVLGEIVTDNLTLGGNSTVTMVLNPNATYDVLRVALLQ